jgi:phosphopantothenoylcysteine decarboxylase/phosphopantothenate--cysteine ligase
LKRNGALTLTLEATPDIAHEVAERRRPGTLLIAFAAECADAETSLANGRAKLVAKGADALFLNDVGNPAITFGSADNAGTWITADSETRFAVQPKTELAQAMLTRILALRS